MAYQFLVARGYAVEGALIRVSNYCVRIHGGRIGACT
jgi:hypothetical protein